MDSYEKQLEMYVKGIEIEIDEHEISIKFIRSQIGLLTEQLQFSEKRLAHSQELLALGKQRQGEDAESDAVPEASKKHFTRQDLTEVPKTEPTHRCKICGALWKEWEDSWSLISDQCGECCDQRVMGDQIEKIEDVHQYKGAEI